MAGVEDLERADRMLSPATHPVRAGPTEDTDAFTAEPAERLGLVFVAGLDRIEHDVEDRGRVAGQEQQRLPVLAGSGGVELLGPRIRVERGRGDDAAPVLWSGRLRPSLVFQHHGARPIREVDGEALGTLNLKLCSQTTCLR